LTGETPRLTLAMSPSWTLYSISSSRNNRVLNYVPIRVVLSELSLRSCLVFVELKEKNIK
jgi:hypothetical protein